MRPLFLVILSSLIVFSCSKENDDNTSKNSGPVPNVIPFVDGRIAISSDGNDHDEDDWSATPFTLAILASQNLQNKTVLYTFSDHVWGSTGRGKEEMRISALGGKERFNFNTTRFIEAVEQPEQAFNAMRDEILKSSENDPLYIIAAGPMEVVGQGIDRAFKHPDYTDQFNYVRMISHSDWNNNHGRAHNGWTWDDLKELYEAEGLIFDRIVDQNGDDATYQGLFAPRAEFEWLLTSPFNTPAWDWLYERQEVINRRNGNYFDSSDAGMIIYLLTGKQFTDPADAKALMEN